jgi:pimeloyl-ACP methyl ester carboxylesterase
MKIDGAEYHFRTSGSGEPVLLLHAFPLSSEAFWPQLDAPPAGCRIICPDHRGFGQSAPKGALTIESMAADAFRLLDALGLYSAVIGGVSMGGYVAMAMLRLDPARVKGLVLIDTQALADDQAGKDRREATAKDVEANGMAPLVTQLLPRLLSDDVKPYLRSRVEGIMRSANPVATAAASRAMAKRDDSREILARYSGPALVVVGERDVITPLDKAVQMTELMPKSRLVKLDGAGHLANLEAPQAFSDELADFVSSIG